MIYSKHALQRLSERNIKKNMVNEILNNPEIIKKENDIIVITSFNQLRNTQKSIIVVVFNTIKNRIVTVYFKRKEYILDKYCYW